MTGNLTVKKDTWPIIYIKNSGQDRSVAASTNAGTQYLSFTDKNDATLGSVGIERYTNGRNTIKLQAFSADGTSAPAVRVNAYADNTIGCEFPRCTTKATTKSSARSDLVAVVVQNYVSGTSWYRVWSDGWIEQGGDARIGTGDTTITFLKPFSNGSYTFTCTPISPDGAQTYVTIKSLTAKNIVVYLAQNNFTKNSRWYACGY